MTVRPTPARRTLLWRGLTRACAVCGQRGLTRRWVTLADDCPRCGFHFERQPGHFVGAVGINTIVTFGLLLLTLIVGIAVTWPDIRALPLLAVMMPIALFVPLFLHPTAKTVWVAIDLAMKPLEAGEALGATEERATK